MQNSSTQSAKVLYNGKMAGVLSKTRNGYRFTYDSSYMLQKGSRPVSITLPFTEDTYEVEILFPAFVNMLSEGANKRMQCQMLKIDENDYFQLLLATLKEDSIGPITIKAINEHS